LFDIPVIKTVRIYNRKKERFIKKNKKKIRERGGKHMKKYKIIFLDMDGVINNKKFIG